MANENRTKPVLPLLLLLFLCAYLLWFNFLRTPSGAEPGIASMELPDGIQLYDFRIVNSFPHDPRAFTQGLVVEGQTLYEGTGLIGRSSLREVALESGEPVRLSELPERYFGEGMTLYGNRLIQLTWQARTGFVYDRNSFELLHRFNYPTEGWGITHDGERLIMSDGSDSLYRLHPETFELMGRIAVRSAGGPLERLNELEYVEGKLYANVWTTSGIAIIAPETGMWEGWIELERLVQRARTLGSEGVLNGIAYDPVAKRLFVTGKLWPELYEIKLIPRRD